MRKTSPESIILFTDNCFIRVGVRQLLYQKEIKDVGKSKFKKYVCYIWVTVDTHNNNNNQKLNSS